ncbi:MAG: DUF2155 domain-containing protein [Beijerinckiaceae bacterium]|jgi:hypothetical protein
MTRLKLSGLALAAFGALLTPPALADKISHPTAVFSGLDKITGRIISFEVATDETVQFGSLQITERACYTRPSTEAPQTITFVQVDEVDAKKQYKRLFSGWMFAASPGLHGIEHPVYDIWLTDCKGGTEVIPAPPETANAEPPPPENAKLPVNTGKKPRNADAKAPATSGTADAAATVPRRDPNRRPPTRSFFPDEAGGRDPGGLY